MAQVNSFPGCKDPASLPVVPNNVQIPNLPANFQANLPVASQMDVSRPGWPHEVNSTTKTIKST